MSAYEEDFAQWSLQQAALLRRRASGELMNDAAVDWENIAEEIESLGRHDRREVHSRLARLLHHLLKWRFQPEYQSRSWKSTIALQRREIEKLLEQSPSLRPFSAAILASAYADGLRDAQEETGVYRLPAECPWLIEQVLDGEFWPGTLR
jgi:hypothetical protein